MSKLFLSHVEFFRERERFEHVHVVVPNVQQGSTRRGSIASSIVSELKDDDNAYERAEGLCKSLSMDPEQYARHVSELERVMQATKNTPPGMLPAKGQWLARDLARQASMAGLPLLPTPTAREILPPAPLSPVPGP